MNEQLNIILKQQGLPIFEDDRKIFLEREHVLCLEIFKLLDNYNHKRDHDRLAAFAFQLRDIMRHRKNLQA